MQMYVCLSVLMLCPSHGFVFKDTNVWFSPNVCKFQPLGVSVPKKIHQAKPEVTKLCTLKSVYFFTVIFLLLSDLDKGEAIMNFSGNHFITVLYPSLYMFWNRRPASLYI